MEGLRLDFVLMDEAVLFEERDVPRVCRTPNCLRCGRFCRITGDTYEYDGNGTQNYVTFDCSGCGPYTEGMW